MASLLLKLSGPMQSWGDSSRFNRRATRTEPTKSGVIGLLAAACGRRRSDSIEDLLGLKFGVRTDQPGTIMRDFQTEVDWRTGKARPLTNRYYLSDAVFVAAIEGEAGLISDLHDALKHPVFPLYLGRRSCPPGQLLVLGQTDASYRDALMGEPWHASERHRRSEPATVRLPVVRDALPGEEVHESPRDLPVSFDVRYRQYTFRNVVHEATPPIHNPMSRQASHDPLALAGGFDVPIQA